MDTISRVLHHITLLLSAAAFTLKSDNVLIEIAQFSYYLQCFMCKATRITVIIIAIHNTPVVIGITTDNREESAVGLVAVVTPEVPKSEKNIHNK